VTTEEISAEIIKFDGYAGCEVKVENLQAYGNALDGMLKYELVFPNRREHGEISVVNGAWLKSYTNTLGAPQWLKDRMEAARNRPMPSAAQVEQQFRACERAAAEYLRDSRSTCCHAPIVIAPPQSEFQYTCTKCSNGTGDMSPERVRELQNGREPFKEIMPNGAVVTWFSGHVIHVIGPNPHGGFWGKSFNVSVCINRQYGEHANAIKRGGKWYYLQADYSWK
jgi:hypothetical protein